jgi:hypothetical protein
MRKIQSQLPRIETGVVQFGGDWPGVFIRGDDARALAQVLHYCLKQSARQGLIYGRLDYLVDLLESCQVKEETS